MSRGPIAVVTALPEEMSGLARRLSDGRRRRAGGVSCLDGRLAGRRAVLAVTGDGAAEAANGAARLLDLCGPSLLLGLGVAGALSPELGRGGMVAARRVVDATGVGRAADPGWLRRAVALEAVVGGLLVSVDRVLDTSAAKRSLWSRLGEPRPAAVDLESVAWSGAAAARGVPWLVLRAISDTADEELPLPFGRLHSRRGGVSRGRVVAALARRPGRLPAVLALRRQVVRLAARLATVVEELLA